jgi:hypothetical protein
MIIVKPVWKPDAGAPAGGGTAARRFVARIGRDRLVIEVSPRGEGRLTINDVEIARVTDARGSREAFRELKKAAERRLRQLAAERAAPTTAR